MRRRFLLVATDDDENKKKKTTRPPPFAAIMIGLRGGRSTGQTKLSCVLMFATVEELTASKNKLQNAS